MPLSYSIADGIVFGVISYIILKLFSGRVKEISITTVIIGFVFILKFLKIAIPLISLIKKGALFI